jgi:hypothetical protein
VVILPVKIDDEAHVKENDLELYAFGRLEVSGEPTLESHLETCKHCRDRLRELRIFTHQKDELSGRPSRQPEKRSEIRIATNDSGFVRIMGLEVGPRLEARILEASKSGMKIEIGVPIAPAARIQVLLKDISAFAEVRYCRPIGETFQIGVRVVDLVRLPAPKSETQ